MRTDHRTHDVIRPPQRACGAAAEAPTGIAEHAGTTSRRAAALYLQMLRWPGGVECPRCDENDRLLWLDSAREMALLLVPLPVQRHRRHALPQLAPAALEVVRLRPPDDRVARGHLGEPS